MDNGERLLNLCAAGELKVGGLPQEHTQCSQCVGGVLAARGRSLRGKTACNNEYEYSNAMVQ